MKNAYSAFGGENPWMQLHGGGAFVFGDDSGHDLDGFGVKDIAKALSQINRYTGHSLFPHSVAQHSVFVSRLLDFDAVAAMYGLAHDAHECIIGDISQPMKLALRHAGAGEVLAHLERAADSAVRGIFQLPIEGPSGFYAEAVHRADLIALATEYRDILHKRHAWKLPEPAHPTRIKRMPPARAEREFVSRYLELRARLDG